MGVLALLLCGAFSPGAHAAADRPPNVVLIMADDLGYRELGCYGQEKIRTPSIDALAAGGMRFTQFYSGSAVCAPARCVLMTGLHTGHALVRDNWERGGWGPAQPEGQLPLPEGTETLGRQFQRQGYRTAAMGKWGLGGPGTEGEPYRQGFDLFFGYLCQRVAHNLYPTHLWRNTERVDLPGNTWGNHVGQTYAHDEMVKEALGFVDANHASPFFLYLPFHIPHLAIQVPEDSLAEYKGKWEDPPYEGGKGYLPHPTPRAAYAAMITRMDRDIGRLVQRLEELDVRDNTLILFTSDNGPTYDRLGGSDSEFFESAKGFRGLKGSLHEGGIRVPLVANWPGKVPAGTESDHVAALWDLMPTLLEVCDLPAPARTDGLSFRRELLGEPDQPEADYLYWEFPGYGGQQAVRMGPWKAIRTNLKKKDQDHSWQLYDLAKDVGETTNVAAEHPQVLQRVEAIVAEARVPSQRFPLPQPGGN